mmetsp:Transcript_18825/g.36870  ORF Transcript_18825/g.36870 Transcript_18825/m.36870 type:complete len:100 (-) Transcript_18825:1495-1794(-)
MQFRGFFTWGLHLVSLCYFSLSIKKAGAQGPLTGLRTYYLEVCTTYFNCEPKLLEFNRFKFVSFPLFPPLFFRFIWMIVSSRLFVGVQLNIKEREEACV